MIWAGTNLKRQAALFSMIRRLVPTYHNCKLQMKVKHTAKVSLIRTNPKSEHRKNLLMVLMWKNREKKERKNVRQRTSKIITKISPRVKATSPWLSIIFAVDRHLRTPVKPMFKSQPRPRQESILRRAPPLMKLTVTKRS